MNTLRHTLAAAFAALSIAAPVSAAPPQVSDAWARPTVAGQSAGGGFLKIVGGAAPDRLVGVTAPVAARVELHTMAMEGDVMRMRELDAIDVPAGRTVELKPGGLHVMLMGLKAPLAAGASFPLTLRFEKGGEVTLPMRVLAHPAEPASAHKH